MIACTTHRGVFLALKKHNLYSNGCYGSIEQYHLFANTGTQEEYKKELAAYLNHLLVNDFPALVQILYRVDVSEKI